MEKWKDIPDYEGIYQASNLGRIRTSPGKITHTKKHGDRHWESRILKTRGKQVSGYRVALWKEGNLKDWLIARLVAMTWCDGYSEELTVNHINGDRFDNRVENLEWLTLKENIRHGFRTGLYPQTKVKLTNISNGEIIEFVSMSAASRFLGRSSGYLSNLIKKNVG